MSGEKEIVISIYSRGGINRGRPELRGLFGWESLKKKGAGLLPRRIITVLFNFIAIL